MRTKLCLTAIAATLVSAGAHAGSVTFSETTYLANAGPVDAVAPGIPDLTPVMSIVFTGGEAIKLSAPLIKDNELIHPVQNPVPGNGDVFRGVGTIDFTIPSTAFGFYIAPNFDVYHAGDIYRLNFQLKDIETGDTSLNADVFPYDPTYPYDPYHVFFGFYGGGHTHFELTEVDYDQNDVALAPDPFGYLIGGVTSGKVSSTLPTSIPEPASLALLGIGLTGLGLGRRRRA